MATYDERLRAALLEQHKRWFDYGTGALKAEVAEAIDCPVCGSREHRVYFVKDMFRFTRCSSCAMVYLNPRLNVPSTYAFYNSEWTAIYNESKFENASASTALDDKFNAANLDLLSRHQATPGRGKLLEIGFGGGYFLQAARKRGYEVFGIDVDHSNYVRAKGLFGANVKNTDLFEAGFDAGGFDITYMRDVFEHVPNPKPMLAEINRLSRPGALVFIEVPNIEGLIYKFVGKRHVCVFGFAHLNYWAPATMERILRDTGFEIAEIRHDSLDFTLGELVRYFLEPSFTTVDHVNQNPLVRFALKVARRMVNLKWVRLLDRRYTPVIADRIGRGSVIRVVARKRAS